MTAWSEPENDVALLRAELDACRTEIAVLRRQVDIERSNNRALVIHLDQRAEHIAALNAEVQRLEGLLRGRD